MPDEYGPCRTADGGLTKEGLEHLADLLQVEMAKMSDQIVFQVKTTWANSGRTGSTSDVVVANDAQEALQIAWAVEDPRDLRTVSITWLCPLDCIKQADIEDDTLTKV